MEEAGDVGPPADYRAGRACRPARKRGQPSGCGTRRSGQGTRCTQGGPRQGRPAVGILRVAVQGAKRDLAAADRARMHVGRCQASAEGTDVHGIGFVAADQSAIESADQGHRTRNASNSGVGNAGRCRRGPVPGLPGSPWRDTPVLFGPHVPRAAGYRVWLRVDRARPRGRYPRPDQPGDLGRLGATGPAPGARASAQGKRCHELTLPVGQQHFDRTAG